MAFSSHRLPSLAIAAGLSVVLVWLLLREIENKAILYTLQQLSLPLALLAFLLYVLIYLSRAVRFNSLLRKPVPLGTMFTIMCLHNVINIALPARSGELSYPYLLRKQGIPYAESLSSLIAARLFDLVSIGVLFAAMLPFVRELPAFTQNMLYWFLAMIALVFVILAALVLWKLQLKGWIETMRSWVGMKDSQLLTRIQHLGGDTVDAIRTYANRKMIGRLALHSLCQWFLMFLFSYVVLRALGMDVTLPQSFIGSSLSMLVLVIPFQGVLGFGTTEAVWVVMFMALGFAKADLIPYAFASHIVVLLFTAAMGMYGVLKMKTLHGSTAKAA